MVSIHSPARLILAICLSSHNLRCLVAGTVDGIGMIFDNMIEICESVSFG